jgi:catechol 2,3-dioxygenase-like lactoylglutathione lyase family enzyme
MPEQPSDPDVSLHHVALYVSDLASTRRFYRNALGMEEIARPADFTFPGAYFRLGTAEVHVVVETEAGRTEELRQQWSPDELKTGYTVPLACAISSRSSRDWSRTMCELRAALVSGLTTSSSGTSPILTATSSN